MFGRKSFPVLVSALAALGNACSSGSTGVSGSGGATAAEVGGLPSAGNLTSLGGNTANGSSTASGARIGTGGAEAFGGQTRTGAAGSGGTSAAGGAAASGGQRPAEATGVATGGSTTSGGANTSSGGRITTGGSTSLSGRANNGGTISASGSLRAGGATATGGLKSAGGTSAGGSAGTVASSGGPSAAGSTSTGPCDIYAADNAPCVAAHSTVRALYAAYSGNLYQVRRNSDKTTVEVPVASPGSYAKSTVQEAFCSGTTCTISIIYDQSPQGNHLTKSPPGGWLNNGGLEADANAAKIKLGGHSVYGVYTTSNFDNDIGAVGYRNNKTKGIATGDQPESMYMVVSGKHYNQWCCFDYGNAETNNLDNGNATMEAVYFGSSTQWGRGSGNGPWVMADLENGVFAGSSFAAPTSNTSIIADFVTAMLKGPAGNRFVLKGGDAQSAVLYTKYDGARPAGYSPMKKEGAIILGIGGDNSHTGEGTFFEGCMTSGVPTDNADNAVQASIAAAGYGR